MRYFTLLVILLCVAGGLEAKTYDFIIVNMDNKAIENAEIKYQDADGKTIDKSKSDSFGKVKIDNQKSKRILITAPGFQSKLIESDDIDSDRAVKLRKTKTIDKKFIADLYNDDVNYVEVKKEGEDFKSEAKLFPKRPGEDYILDFDWREGYRWIREVEVEFSQDELPVGYKAPHIEKVRLESGMGAVAGFVLVDSLPKHRRILNLFLKIVNQDNVEVSNSNWYNLFNSVHLSPGKYDIMFYGEYFDTFEIKGVRVKEGKVTKIVPKIKSTYPMNKDNQNVRNGYGSLYGTIIDKNGEPIIGAVIRLLETSKGNYSKYDGSYLVEKIPEGEYRVNIKMVGMTSKEYNIVIMANKSTELNITLEEDISRLEEVIVTAEKINDLKEYGTGRALKKSKDHSIEVMARASAEGDGGIDMGRFSEDISFSADALMVSDIEQDVSAGLLTAGILNDFQKWDLWNDIASDELASYQKLWKINPIRRYSVMVLNELSNPIIGANVKLLDDKGKTVWATKSDNIGKAELWGEIFEGDWASYYTINVEYDGKSERIAKVLEFHQGINTIKLDAQCTMPNELDISFVVDATGSMGDEIEFLKAELFDIIERSKANLQGVDINMSTMFYRDMSDDYLARKMDFTSDISRNIDFINLNRAGGGGDYPEAVDYALDEAVNNLSWSENPINKLIFIFLDAPPHQKSENLEKLKKVSKEASEKGIRIIPIACSGTNKSTEYLMRSIALSTGGKYIFLTDDSGIGGSHIKPSTDEYEVLTLNEILLQTIIEYGTIQKCELAGDVEPKDEFTYNPDYLKSLAGEEDSEIELKNWRVYPNPTKDNIYIQAEGKLGFIYLADMRGNILNRFDVTGESRFRIDLSRFANGVYYIMSEYSPGKWMKSQIILAR